MPSENLKHELGPDPSEEGNIGENIEVRPPIGVRPRWSWDEERLSEICRAIHHYLGHSREPQREWYEELHEILSRHLNHLHQRDRAAQIVERLAGQPAGTVTEIPGS